MHPASTLAGLSGRGFPRSRAARGVPAIPQDWVVGALLAGAVLFNVCLAVVNAQAMQLGRGHVIAVELVLIGAALALSLLFWRPAMAPWAALLWFLVTLFVALSLARGAVDPKPVRDVVIIPIFVMLGIAFQNGRIVPLLCGLQGVIVAVMIFEALAPERFGAVVNIVGYYVNTRDIQEGAFWNPESNLFASANRPGDRILLPGLGIHRLSSVFLEPVSLGNWAIVATVATVAFARIMSWTALAFMATTIVATLIGCDGRLAISTCVLVVLLAVAVPVLPRFAYLLYLPGVTLCALALVRFLDLRKTADDLSGRVAYSMNLLWNLGPEALAGLDLRLAGPAADSGVTYLVVTQSVLGAAVLWTTICLAQPDRRRTALLFTHGACLYVALNLMISYSLFSIKTAAPLWFMFGYAGSLGAVRPFGAVRPYGAVLRPRRTAIVRALRR